MITNLNYLAALLVDLCLVMGCSLLALLFLAMWFLLLRALLHAILELILAWRDRHQ